MLTGIRMRHTTGEVRPRRCEIGLSPNVPTLGPIIEGEPASLLWRRLSSGDVAFREDRKRDILLSEGQMGRTYGKCRMSHQPLSRREFVGTGLMFVTCLARGETAGATPVDDRQPAPELRTLIRQPLLVNSLYRLPVAYDYTPHGAAGANQLGYRWIEE
jgi:hypothetical protein